MLAPPLRAGLCEEKSLIVLRSCACPRRIAPEDCGRNAASPRLCMRAAIEVRREGCCAGPALIILNFLPAVRSGSQICSVGRKNAARRRFIVVSRYERKIGKFIANKKRCDWGISRVALSCHLWRGWRVKNKRVRLTTQIIIAARCAQSLQ